MAVWSGLSSDFHSLASWQYFANWALAVIVALAFVFYFARLVGYILSVILEILLWKRYHVRITIGSFRIAPLGGRVMARHVVVTTADYTVSIIRLNLTWRYWILKSTRLSSICFSEKNIGNLENPSKLTAAQNMELPSSLLLHMEGLEIFMYNRTAAFTNIEEALRKESESESSSKHSIVLDHASKSETSASSSASESTLQSNWSALNYLLQVLPLQIKIKRGAFVLGNHTTPSILVASFRTAKALLDLSGTPSNLDLYRTSLDFNLDRFQVHMKPNITYDPEMYSRDRPISFKRKATAATKNPIRKQTMVDMLAHLRLKRSSKKSRLNKGVQEWHGLKRYVGNYKQQRIMELADVEEYAKYSLILDSVETQILYFYDVPGLQPRKDSVTEIDSSSPQSGIEIVLSMATIHYGSWADRQRGPLQSLLFPGLARDGEPSTSHNEQGTLRKYAEFNISVLAKNELILKVPTREFSKDKEELSSRDDLKQKNTRPFGWIEYKLAKGSEFVYCNSYIATSRGWANKLSAKMLNLEVRSSVTHEILFTADKHTIDADIGFPLAWNGECVWDFNMSSANGKFFFLREHITLFVDLVADFGSGPPVKFENYRPFTYNLAWSISAFSLYFNVNDHNIINDPLDFDTNRYICFSGPKMDVKLKLPLKGMFATSTTIEYELSAPSLNLSLEVPTWHTVRTFMNGGKKMGATDAFEISGSYTYFNKVEVDHNNFLVIDITGDNITLLFHGYFIRYLFTLRENYFGDFVNFRTYEEYILSEDVLSTHSETDSINTQQRPDYWKLAKAENDLNIQFTFKARKGKIILPCQIYDFSHHICLCLDFVDVDIHLCQYYMDLQADFSTAKGYRVTENSLTSRDMVFESIVYTEVLSTLNAEVLIDTFQVHTHRMLGIDDLTYHCKWDFASDLISIDGFPSTIASLQSALSSFSLGYKDLENSLTYQVPTLYDASNYSFRCPEIKVRLFMDVSRTFLEINIDDMLVTLNDIANTRYSSRVSLLIPKVTMRIVDELKAETYDAILETSLHLTNFCEKLNMIEHRDRQQAHILRNDATTHRASFLLFSEEKNEEFREAKASIFPTISLPSASYPLTEESMFFQEYDESIESFSESSLGYSEESSIANEEMYPTTSYYDDEFRPSLKPDGKFKTDSFILKFDTVSACMCPKGLCTLLNVLSGVEITDIEVLLDKLQCEIITDLKKLIFPVPMINNVRLVCPSIDIKIFEGSVSSITSAMAASQSVPVINFTITQPSLVLQKQHSRAQMGAFLEEHVATTVALHVGEAYVAISLPHCFSAAFRCSLSDVEAWFTKEEGRASVVALSLGAFKLSLNENMVENVIKFVMKLVGETKAAFSKFKKANEIKRKWKGDLIYSLVKFAVTNRQELDPEVITKPARFLRSKRDHVRFYESWKIMTKLRSIARAMAITEGGQFNFSDESSCAPSDAMNYVTEGFKSWRTWEGNMKQRENFFQKIYSKTEDIDCGLKAFLSITTLEINLNGKENVSDYFCMSGLSVQFIKPAIRKSISSGTQKATQTSSCDVAVNITAIDVALTTAILSLFKVSRSLVLTSSKLPRPVVAGDRVSDDAWSFSLAFNLESFLCQVNLPNARFNLMNTKFSASAIAMKSPQSPIHVGWASNIDHLRATIGKDAERFFKYELFKNSVIASVSKQGKTSNVILKSSTKHTEVKISDHKNTLAFTITQFLDHDLSLILKALEKDGTRPKPTEMKTKELNSDMPSLSLKVTLDSLSYSVDALRPLKLRGSLSNAIMRASISGPEMCVEFSLKRFMSELEMKETPLIGIENSSFRVSSLCTKSVGSWLMQTDISLGYFKVNTPQLINALGSILDNENLIVERFDRLKEAVNKSQFLLRKNDQATKGSMPSSHEANAKKLYYVVNFNSDYLGWSTYRRHTRYTVELEDARVTLNNAIGPDQYIGRMSGEFLIPATKFTIYDPSYSAGLSTFLDFHISLKVMNDLDASDKNGLSLQIESEYLRICLCPQTLFRIYELTESVKHKLEHFGGFTRGETATEFKSTSDIDSKSRGTTFSSIHVLSYNLCIGWLFTEDYKDYPGLILGAERIFAVTTTDMGKLTVMDGYMSVANGNTSSSFFSSSSEFDNLNRAFMPKLQLNYYVDSNKKLWLTLKGDELDVRSMSNSTVLIERSMHSSTQVRKFFEEKSRLAEERKRKVGIVKAVKEPTPQTVKKSFDPHFTAVQFIIRFAGAKIYFYKLQEDSLQEEPNSLSLHSPAISIVADYIHSTEKIKKHVVRVEILMSQSDNTAYASCVPVVEDYVRTFKEMFVVVEVERDPIPKLEKERKSSNLGAEFRRILSTTDLHLGLRIERQRVSLSCEPTAKVEAVVEYDGASITACSGADYNSIYILGHMNAISASLQHIYSDERSGSFSINSIVLSSMVGFNPDLEMVSLCNVSDISGFVKMKQYQDVDIFTDIWLPKRFDYNASAKTERVVAGKNMLCGTKDETSVSVSVYSVKLDFIISNLSLEVDFGPALGIMMLDVDKAWGLSRKLSSWSYEFKVGIQQLLVKSEGRLGGYLKLGGFFFNSSIEWMIGDSLTLEVPLIHMAAGFGDAQLKSNFDEHLFAFLSLKGWRLDVYNRKDGTNISKDHLFVSIRYEIAEAFLTSLAASDFYDIYETIVRMVEEKRMSYREILEDSNKESGLSKNLSHELLEVARKLDTQIEVFTGVTTVQVYPHSFHDSKVVVISLDRSVANFTQNEYLSGVSNQIELQLNNVMASLSNTAGTTWEKTQSYDVEELSQYASKAKGGLILGFPRFMISMRTYQKFQTNVVEYLYQSSFGGAVDIRWKLGSVNFVREMYAAHKRALSSRTEMAKKDAKSLRKSPDINTFAEDAAENLKSTATAEIEMEMETNRILAGSKTPHKDFDKDIQQTIEKVTKKSKFTYTALAPPIIEAPQLKELGNATPPLEWFGLHRNKFPDATHQFAIVTLQKLLHEIELEYSKNLGKA